MSSESRLRLPAASRVPVRANNWIGEVILACRLRALRQAFPQARISALAKPRVLPVLRHNPDIDRILLYDAAGHRRCANLKGSSTGPKR